MAKILDNNQEVVAAATTANANVAKPIEKAINEAIELARTACQTNGDTSSDCAVAWDVVEELKLAQRAECWGKKPKTSLEQYCNEHPEAGECRTYNV